MSSLHDKVYEFVKNIPRGKVATYGQIALLLVSEGVVFKNDQIVDLRISQLEK